MANQFGGEWTETKIRVFKKYLLAYMQIMKSKSWKLIYFDGFAGSGDIQTNNEKEIIEGIARHVLSFNEPREFDLYYFVEKNVTNAQYLQAIVSAEYPNKVSKTFVRPGEDCNKKLVDMANFLRQPKGKNYKAIAFLDPYGMQVKWSSIEALKGLGVDLWILVPTGIGINRLLTTKEKSPQMWFNILGDFFGLDSKNIEDRFYYQDPQLTMFGDTRFLKVENAIEKACELYQERMQTVFKYVSTPLPLKNRTNSILFHFIAASNSPVAVKIANEIIKQEI